MAPEALDELPSSRNDMLRCLAEVPALARLLTQRELR